MDVTAAKRNATKPTQPKKKGRPPVVFTEAQKEIIFDYASMCVPAHIIADAIGVSRRTLDRKLAENEKLKSKYKAKRSGLKRVLVGTAVQKALEGDKTMIIFLLKTMCNMSETNADAAVDAHAQAEAIRGGLDKLTAGLSDGGK